MTLAPAGVHYVCPRCAVESRLPAFGGAGHFWNVCDDCRSQTYARPDETQRPLYSKEDEDLAALFASSNFSLTHRPHLWEPSTQPPTYASSSTEPSPSTGTSAYSTSPSQLPHTTMLDSSTLRSAPNYVHHNHPPVGMSDRRLDDDTSKARTFPGLLEQQQFHHVHQIVYASSHYNHSAHLVARQQQQQQQRQRDQQEQMQQQQHAEPYMHDGYAHIRQHFGAGNSQTYGSAEQDAGRAGGQPADDVEMGG